MKKGYRAELLARHELNDIYGKENIFKLAIAQQGPDFFILERDSNRVIMVVEVKECHSKKYYPSKKELDQFRRIQEFCKKHGIMAELWIKYPNIEFLKSTIW